MKRTASISFLFIIAIAFGVLLYNSISLTHEITLQSLSAANNTEYFKGFCQLQNTSCKIEIANLFNDCLREASKTSQNIHEYSRQRTSCGQELKEHRTLCDTAWNDCMAEHPDDQSP